MKITLNTCILYSTCLCFRNGSRKAEVCKCIHNETSREIQEVQSNRWKNALKGDRDEKEIKNKTRFNKNQKLLTRRISIFL
jgi:hypothetical protein